RAPRTRRHPGRDREPRLRGRVRPDDGRHGGRAARSTARGNAERDREGGPGNRGGDTRRRARENAARTSLARRRRPAGHDSRRQPPRLAGRLQRRIRRAPSCAPARAGARSRRHRDGAPADMTTTIATLPRRFASLVKIEHTVFALPFAYVGVFFAADGWPGLGNLVWVTVAMVGARTLAMALNRLVDADVDARNPRTAARELPSGALRPAQVLVLSALALAVFLVAVFQLDPIVRWLWPIPIAMFFV